MQGGREWCRGRKAGSGRGARRQAGRSGNGREGRQVGQGMVENQVRRDI